MAIRANLKIARLDVSNTGLLCNFSIVTPGLALAGRRTCRGTRARRPGRYATSVFRFSSHAFVSHFLIFVKLEDHDIRTTILGMGRVVAI